MPYLVALCRNCGSPSYFREGSGSWRCPYCNHVNKASESLMVGRALTAMDALAMVKEIKARDTKPAFERASSLA